MGSVLVKRAVALWEHGVESPSAVGGIPVEYWTTLIDGSPVEDWRYAELAVMHLRDTDLPTLERDWRASALLGDVFIVVRVTEGQRPSFETAKHRRWKEGENVAFVLHVRNHRSVATDSQVRRALLAISPEEAENIWREDLESLSPALRRAFAPESLSTLPALAVLCQGYLAVQDGGAETLRAARERMGWREEFRGSLVDDGEHAAGATTVPSFWTVLLADPTKTEESCRELLSKAATEWRSIGSGEDLPSVVKDLISVIGKDAPHEEQVANAYLAIARHLGGSDD